MSKRPLVRHSVAKATLGECYCPKCHPELHQHVEPEPAPTAPSPSTEAPTYQRPEPIAVGGDDLECALLSGSVARLDAVIADLHARRRRQDSAWHLAWSETFEGLGRADAQARALASTDRDLARAYYARGCAAREVADLPRIILERPRRDALTDAQQRLHALRSAIATALGEGPEWATAPEVATAWAALATAMDAVGLARPTIGDAR